MKLKDLPIIGTLLAILALAAAPALGIFGSATAESVSDAPSVSMSAPAVVVDQDVVEVAQAAQMYRIKTGDTLFEIARDNCTSVPAMMKANPSIKNAAVIHAGKTIALSGTCGGSQPNAVTASVPSPAVNFGKWDPILKCESSGNWAINTGNGYHGGLQFDPKTWTGFGGGEFAPVAYQASPAEQIIVAERVLAKQGWGAWPSCSRKAGYRK